MKDSEPDYLIASSKEIISNHTKWKKDYIYNSKKIKYEFEHGFVKNTPDWIQEWFK